jgi:two-component SAPR family response regulator
VQSIIFDTGSMVPDPANDHGARTGQFHALVVSNNIATAIVAAAIVEKCGLAAKRTSYENSLELIRQENPSILIVDSSCQMLFDYLATLGQVKPFTIFLSVASSADPTDERIDAFVCKPLTVEGLQPVIFEWIKANPNY